MAQVKEPYGLVYNTDGSLCVTYRDDDIPFPGVRSFAVETATTNFLGPYAWEFDSEKTLFYPSGLASGKTWTDCWDEKQKAYVGGQGLTCFEIYTRTIDLGSVQATGTKITLSWKHKGLLEWVELSHSLDNVTFTKWNLKDTLELKGDSSLRLFNISYLRIYIDGKITDCYGQPEQLLDRWYDVEITYTLPTDARYIKIVWDFYKADEANGGLGVLGYIRQPQLEIKPFASSFVNGYRPTGKFIVEPEDLRFNPATDDWVISYWKYPVATSSNSSNGYNLCSIGRWTSGTSEGYLWWGKENNSNVFRISVVYNDSTGAIAGSSSFDPAWYFRNWHHEVVLKHGSEMQYWIDGTLQVQLALAKPLLNNFVVGLSLGGSSGIAAHNSYIANVYYGLYTDQWTDEYIREVYEAQIPFAVSNKLSIY